MELKRLLDIRPGVTALIGGGGKTTLLYALGAELAQSAPVLLCTTTHIYPPTHIPCLVNADAEAVAAVLQKSRLVCVGSTSAEGKLSAPALSMAELLRLAPYVLVEADGARGRPIKAHAAHEPVIPAEADQTVLVIGASGLGKPIRDAVHRPALFCQALGAAEDEPVTPVREAAFVKFEALHDRVLLNQMETPEQTALCRALAKELNCPVCAGALQKERLECWY